jgi:hypothetical protein
MVFLHINLWFFNISPKNQLSVEKMLKPLKKMWNSVIKLPKNV